MTAIENRIQELRNIQSRETECNFPNGNLWNECEDKIFNLKTYGQEPELVNDGDVLTLENGEVIEFAGLTFENQ